MRASSFPLNSSASGSRLGTAVLIALLIGGGSALLLGPATWLSSPLALALFLSCIVAGVAAGYHTLGYQRRAVSTSVATTSPLLLIAVFGVVFAGGAIRFHSLHFGKPHFYHPDEQTKVRVVRDMAKRRSLNPKYFRHPSLLLYSTYGAGKVLNRLGIETDNTAMRVVLGGRVVSAVAGTLSILLLYLIGSRLFSPLTSLIAASVLAFSPLHITCSRYVKEDVLCTFFILASFLAAVVASQRKQVRWLYGAALLAGFAAGSKYTGITAFGIVLAIPWLVSGRFLPDWRYVKHLPTAFATTIVGFLVTTPFAYFTFERFMRDFRYEGRHLMKGHPGSYIDAWSQLWMWHFIKSIIPGITFPVAFVAVVGIGMFLIRRRPVELLIVALIAVFYLPAEYGPSKPMPQPDRYVVPCIPFMALAAAECWRRLSVPALKVALACLLVLAPVYRSLALARDISVDTRVKMVEYVRQNVPRDSSILLIGSIAYLPRLPKDEYRLESKPVFSAIEKVGVDEMRALGKQYLILNSFSNDRFYETALPSPGAIARFKEYDDKLVKLAEITAPSGSYGFHNPRLTLYAIPPAPAEAEPLAPNTGENGAAHQIPE